MIRILRRLSEARYAVGTPHTLLIAPLWLVRRRYLILEMDIRSYSPSASPLSWEKLTGEALAQLLDANPGMNLEDARARESDGQICYATRVEGKVIHYRWYSTRPSMLPFLKAAWYPQEGDYTVFGAYTHPDHRGRGIHKAIQQQGLARARALGLRRVVSFIAEWNRPSIRAAESAGLRQSGAVTLWTLGLIHWHSRSGSAQISDGRLSITRAKDQQIPLSSRIDEFDVT